MAKKLTYFILAGLVFGVLAGWLIHLNGDALRATFIQWGWIKPDPETGALLSTAETLEKIGGYMVILSDIFLRLIKMIIAPLVFATLVAGIAHMGDTAALGRVGLKSLTWFIGASLVSLSLGLVL